MKKIISSIIYILFFQNTFSDWIRPTESCYEPSKPYRFNSQYEIDSYKREIEQYKQCIMDFIEKQKNEAKTHHEAANNAIEKWNNFVRLNS